MLIIIAKLHFSKKIITFLPRNMHFHGLASFIWKNENCFGFSTQKHHLNHILNKNIKKITQRRPLFSWYMTWKLHVCFSICQSDIQSGLKTTKYKKSKKAQDLPKIDPIVLKTFLVPNYTKLMPENMVPGQKVKKVIFTGFSPPPIFNFSRIKL